MTNSITEVENIDSESLIKPLTRWLEKTAPEIGTPITLEKFSIGQSNPTYRLQTNSKVNHGKFVLRVVPEARCVCARSELMMRATLSGRAPRV